MDRTKLTAFLLMIASLGAVLFVLIMASTPLLVPDAIQYPGGPPVPPGCFVVMALVILLPLAGIPGVVGLTLWSRTVRRRIAERKREITSWPAQETALQNGYDRLTFALMDGTLEDGELLAIHKIYESLGKVHRIRWYRFLAACEAPGQLLLWADPTTQPEPAKVSERGARALAFGLLLFGLLCLLMTALVFAVAPYESWIHGSGCLPPGISTLAGGVGLVLMLHRELQDREKEKACKALAEEALLDRCERRLERLLGYGLDHPEGKKTGRLARASVFDALEQLDGERKARLILSIHARGLTATVSLQGANLRKVNLAEVDLTGAVLSGTDLSGAILAGSCLEGCDLRNCRLVSADIRRAVLHGADLRQGDLRCAWLHYCDLRQADLRNTDLRGANLWQSDMTGANLQDSFVSNEQLGSVSSLEGASLS